MQPRLLLPLIVLLLAGCSGPAQHTAVLESGAIPAPQAVDSNPFDRLPPLPPYAEPDPLARAAKLVSPGLALAGSEHIATGGETSAGYGSLILHSSTDSSDLSWGMYRLPALYQANDQFSYNLKFLEQEKGYWLGISNYGLGRWEWAGPEYALARTSRLLPEHSRADGSVFLLFVVLGGDDIAIQRLGRWGYADEGEWLVPPSGDQILTVGPDKTFSTLEAAYAAAPDTGGATILVYQQLDNAPYSQTALLIEKPGIRFWGIHPPNGERVKLDGTGFDYSGAGAVPRAVFQFNPGADGGAIKDFEITGARNASGNGAGVRINQANNISILDCVIHGCDMGIMSNGDASSVPPSGTNQLIQESEIYGNGSLDDPGFSHNLYLGGTSATLRACEVHHSLGGHNVKSRAHFNRIEYCYIHHSVNRELDLVDDAVNTALPGSDSVVLGCVIAKDPLCPGNRNVIHFGADGGNPHNGTLHLVNNTLLTPFISPVVALAGPGVALSMINNIFHDQVSGSTNHSAVHASGGASQDGVSGSHNWFSFGFGQTPGQVSGLAPETTWRGAQGIYPVFEDPDNGDYRLLYAFVNILDAGLDWELATAGLPPTPGYSVKPADILSYEYRHKASWRARKKFLQTEIGACEYDTWPH